MALVDIYHVVAASRAVASGESINEGQVVSLDSTGEVVLQSVTDSVPYGIAGDTKSTSASSMPGINSGYQNRVSDYFDETSASGKMTVYHSGGEFATDQFASTVTAQTPFTALYANDGVLDNVDGNTTNTIIARLTQAAGGYPSGVPGVDVNGDIALSGDNSNTYIEFKLLV